MKKSRVIIDATSAGVHVGSRAKEGGDVMLDVTEYEMMKVRTNKLPFGTIIMHEGREWFVKLEKQTPANFTIRLSLLEEVERKSCVGKRAFVHDKKYYLVLTSMSHSLNKSGGQYWWNVIGNPTSAITGSNVRPAQMIKKNKVDSLRLMTSYCFRMFLDVLHLQNTTIADRVRLGLFTMHNIQFALYLPVSDKKKVLNLLSTAYGKGIVTEDGKSISFARLLKFKYKSYEKTFDALEEDLDIKLDETSEYSLDEDSQTGFMLFHKEGTKSVFSIGMYDKEAHGEKTGLDHLNSDRNKRLISDAIRVDITLHKRFYEVLFNSAQKLKDIDYYIDEDYEKQNLAINVCKAIAILDEYYPGGFTGWLVRKIIIDRMCLFSVWSILDFNYDVGSLVKQFFEERNKTYKGTADLSEVYDKWINSEQSDTLKKILLAMPMSSKTAYALAEEMEKATGLSPNVPYIVVTGMQAEMLTAGFKVKEYHRYVKAVREKDFASLEGLFEKGKSVINALASVHRKKALTVLNNETRTGTISMVTAKAR